MHLRALLAWLLVAALLMAGSLTCSSLRSLGGADGGDSKAWAGAGGGVVREYHGGGEKAAATARRSLGLRAMKPTPIPNRMKANAMPVSPPARIG
uniref:Uncharacterized protein n=1 Tax=Oryza meridionalis TaxID=40149 RepID=A0A0E0DXX1_9ORYZ